MSIKKIRFKWCDGRTQKIDQRVYDICFDLKENGFIPTLFVYDLNRQNKSIFMIFNEDIKTSDAELIRKIALDNTKHNFVYFESYPVDNTGITIFFNEDDYIKYCNDRFSFDEPIKVDALNPLNDSN